MKRLCILLPCLLVLAVLPQDNDYRHLVGLKSASMATLENVEHSSTEDGRTGFSKVHGAEPASHQRKTGPALLSTNSNLSPDYTPEASRVTLTNQNAIQLWATWKKLVQDAELQEIPVVNVLLAGRIRKNPDPLIYQDMHALFLDPDIALEKKALLLDLLTEIATPEALAELLALAESGQDSSLYAFILQAISRIGDNLWDGRFHEELSPILESAWQNPDLTDEKLLHSIGTAIAEVGAPSGIDLLLQSIGSTGRLSGNAASDRSRPPVAYSLSGKVHNPKATKTLEICLVTSASDTPSAEFCIAALGGLDTPEATEILLNHAQSASDGEVRQIGNAIDKIQNEEALKLIVQAPGQRQFKSTKVEEAIGIAASDIAASSITPSPNPSVGAPPLH